MSMRGRNLFAWHAWLKPIGLPVAAGLAEWQWKRSGSATRAAATAAGALVGIYAVSQLDFERRRRQWRRDRLLT